MAWFHNPESGQTFEAEGIWEQEARQRGYEEVDAPDGKKRPEPKPDEADAKKAEQEEGKKTPEPEPKPDEADAKGGKEKK